MCGIAGFSGVASLDTRFTLTWALGLGIDRRGGDASGFVTLRQGEAPLVGRKLGTWGTAKGKFLRHVTHGAASMMHARFATCGNKAITEAHPFAVFRDGSPVLYGCHNGVIDNARESARKHGRPYDVDSRELFELLADGDLQGIQALEGYGVITWIDMSTPDRIHVARLSSDSQLYVGQASDRSIVWGSTENIVRDALEEADLELVSEFQLDAIGTDYYIQGDRVCQTARTGIQVAKRIWTAGALCAKYSSNWEKEDDEWASLYGDAESKRLDEQFRARVAAYDRDKAEGLTVIGLPSADPSEPKDATEPLEYDWETMARDAARWERGE